MNKTYYIHTSTRRKTIKVQHSPNIERRQILCKPLRRTNESTFISNYSKIYFLLVICFLGNKILISVCVLSCELCVHNIEGYFICFYGDSNGQVWPFNLPTWLSLSYWELKSKCKPRVTGKCHKLSASTVVGTKTVLLMC